jgi:protein KRI1
MSGIYGDDVDYDEDGKPTWDDDIDIGDIVDDEQSEPLSKKDKKKKKKKKDKEAVQEDGVDVDVMDADVEKFVDDEEWDGTEEMRKRKMGEYMDEIYGLDFNDMACLALLLPSLHERQLTLFHLLRSAGCPRDSIILKSSLNTLL